MKLISMVEYVSMLAKLFREWKEGNAITLERVFEDLRKIELYCEFLKQKLTLGMFVPCDSEGNVLKKKEPKDFGYNEESTTSKSWKAYEKYDLEYQQAQERVLFKGNWKHSRDDRYINMNWVESEKLQVIPLHSVKTIEDLIQYNIKITPNSIKQLK